MSGIPERGISRRRFLRNSCLFIGGLAGDFSYNLTDVSYRNSKREDLGVLKEIDKIDRECKMKFPCLDVYNSLCREDNYHSLGREVQRHLANLKKLEIPRKEKSSPEVMKDCMEILSGITGFRIDKEPEIEDLENRGRTYAYLLASASGTGLAYLEDKYMSAGDKRGLASGLLSILSGMSLSEGGLSYMDDEVSPFYGKYVEGTGKMKLKSSNKKDADLIMHESAHFILDMAGCSIYGRAIKEGFAGGVELLGTKAYDRRKGTNYAARAEGELAFRLNSIYNAISESFGYPQPEDLLLIKMLFGSLFTSKKFMGDHEVGDALFQVLERKHGQDIYKKILKREDGIFEDFIYGKGWKP